MTDKTDKKNFKLDDLTLDGFDLSELTIGDLEDLADLTGLTYGEIDALGGRTFGSMPPNLISALIWIANRRQMEGLTLEAVREIPVLKLNEILAGSASDVPKEKEPPAGS